MKKILCYKSNAVYFFLLLFVIKNQDEIIMQMLLRFQVKVHLFKTLIKTDYVFRCT